MERTFIMNQITADGCVAYNQPGWLSGKQTACKMNLNSEISACETLFVDHCNTYFQGFKPEHVIQWIAFNFLGTYSKALSFETVVDTSQKDSMK